MNINKAFIRTDADTPCHILCFGKDLCPIKARDYTEIFQPKDKHIIRLPYVFYEGIIE